MAFISFGAAIYDPTQSDTTPSNLATLTPGGGGFTPGGRDVLKNLAGHLIANGGWTLAGVAGNRSGHLHALVERSIRRRRNRG